MFWGQHSDARVLQDAATTTVDVLSSEGGVGRGTWDISGMENISTIEVEAALFTHPAEAALVGRPDMYRVRRRACSWG
jgi:hypothetical protein